MKQSGFTLIEIVIVILIMSIVVPGVTMGIRTMVVQSQRAEKITVATDLARYYMELALSKRYDEATPPIYNGTGGPPVWSAIGLDGETCALPPTTLDDVDDFNCFSTPTAIPGFTGYTLTMNVAYMTVDTSGGVEDGIWGTPTVAGPTNAKRIRVQVTHALIGTVTLNCVTGALY